MSKICPNCSQPMGDDDKFCGSCGAKTEAVVPEAAQAEIPETPVTETPAVEAPAAEAPVAETPVTEAPAPEAAPVTEASVQPQINPAMQGYPQTAQPVYGANGAVAPAKKKGKGLLITLIIIIAVLVLGGAACVYFIFFNGGGYEKPIKAYFDYIASFSDEDLISAVGEDQLTYIVEKKNSSDMDTLRLGCERTKKVYDALGVNMKVENYEIKDEDKMDSDALDSFKDNFDGKLDVTDGYYVTVEYKVEGGGDLGLTGNQSEELSVLKINGDWCVSLKDTDISAFISLGEISDDDFDMYMNAYKNADSSSLE